MGELLFGRISWDDLSLGVLLLGEMLLGELSLGELSWGKLSLGNWLDCEFHWGVVFCRVVFGPVVFG